MYAVNRNIEYLPKSTRLNLPPLDLNNNARTLMEAEEDKVCNTDRLFLL